MRWRNAFFGGLLIGSLVPAAASAKPSGGARKASKVQPNVQKVSVKRKPSRSRESRTVEPAASSFFLAANPHVPLAVVREGSVRAAVPAAERGKTCGSKRRWAAVDSTWHALDAWGKLLGTATVEVVEDYDVTACGEVHFAPKFDRNTNGMLFVSTDSAYVPAPSFEWKAPGAATWKLQKIVSELTTRRKLPYECSEIPKAVRTFHFGEGAGEHQLAVAAGDRGFVITAFADGVWKSEHEVRVEEGKLACYRPVSILDMNGDGRPEVVMRAVYGSETWRDVVLVRDRDGSGHWTVVAVSPGGGTA